MLEMRDMYMEEDVYQLQDLRQQLDQANKTCRILQYRLRKAERRSLRVAQTGQVDGELIRGLEQDVKVAKDVSIRLHNELEAVEKKRCKLEQENEELLQKVLDLEVAKQVLQTEFDKTKENSLKKRGVRSVGKTDKKPSPQEDSADLKCQLHFAKEESALMCKKLTKMAKDNESMKEELVKYRSLYGDLDSSLSIEEVADSPHSREAELKVHLKLVEEEANILSRRIVELEVENRGLRAEMDDMKCQGDREHGGHLLLASTNYGENGESIIELKRHLQFVEEEADLLRRSLLELEEQNKMLMNDLNKYKSDHDLDTTMSEDSCSVISEPSQEELITAKLQIGELSGKVKKLQYENRVLLSNLQRCDLASYHSTRLAMETDAEAGDSAECVPTTFRREDTYEMCAPEILRGKDYDDLIAIKDQASLVTKAIEMLMSESNGFMSFSKLCPNVESTDPNLSENLERNECNIDTKFFNALNMRLSALQRELSIFMEKVDTLGDSLREQTEAIVPYSLLTEPQDSLADVPRKELGSDQKPEFRGQMEREIAGHIQGPQDIYLNGITEDHNNESDQDRPSEQIKELQSLLYEAKESIQILQEQLSQERQKYREDVECFAQRITQLKEEQQKALVRRDFEFQSLSLQTRLEQKFWSQERNLIVQESQQVKKNILLLNLKLRWFLKQWRLGKKLDNEEQGFLEVKSVKDLYMLIHQEDLASHQVDNKTVTADDPSQNSLVELSSSFADLKEAVRDMCMELQEERRSSQELTQQFAKAKAAWEVERTELKCSISQLDCKASKPNLEKAPPELKATLKREREEHQHLLADSYAAVMDLTKQLQISEKNWSREKLELLERFSQEQSQWEQCIRDSQNKLNQVASPEKITEKETSSEAETKGTNLQRTKSVSSMSEFESLLDNMADLNEKNWKYLTNEKALIEKADPFKTWDCSTTMKSFSGHDQSLANMQRSYTAPDKTGIRIYYSPPVARRMDGSLSQGTNDGKMMVEPGYLFTMAKPKDLEKSENPLESTYSRWLCNFSKQHRDLLESSSVSHSVVASGGLPSSFHSLEISGNMSDDMKEMTNCVRQAIRSSSLERKSKDTASQTILVSTTATQTTQFVSIGLQTDGPRSSLHTKSWSPRNSSLMSARSRQISTSLEKVHNRIERPCCSPKYGSPKLQRKLTTSSSKLDSTKDRSLWNLHHRGHSGSAWARSTTTRDSPVLSGLNDGLSSLFNVVEHNGSTESLWKGVTQEAKTKTEVPKYGIVQEFFRNVCGRVQTPTASMERLQCTQVGNYSSWLKHLLGEFAEALLLLHSSNSSVFSLTRLSLSLQDVACDCTSQSLTSCFSRSARSVTRHSPAQCNARTSDPCAAEDKTDGSE
uniref:Microtubule crosslinking factor 2 n=1 Tax=Erpetoichthys calabaricus TaxID=27687 RepID=A0A8C4SCQ8_ERPCA